ncbi:MAG: hypothetical protein HC802_02080 [Caldilineaceae bacterium]|nr:hypothetical protein [Caldilineaceae bacterium]
MPFRRGADAAASSFPSDFYALPCPEGNFSQELRMLSFDMIHVIFTPFWAGPHPPISLPKNVTLQGYQNARTRARFHTLETFAAPSLRKQSLSHFLWIVIVDDATLQEPNILADLTQLLEEQNRAYPSRNAFLVKHRTPASMVGQSSMMEEPRQRVVRWKDVVIEYAQGNLEILQGDGDMWDHAKSFSSSRSQSTTTTDHSITPKVLLETMLTVDASLHHRGVEWMQIMASRYAEKLQQFNNNNHQKSYLRAFLSSSSTSSSEWYMCGASALEWHNPDILLIKQNVYEEQGISVGRVGRRDVTNGCPSAGMTRVVLSSIVEDSPSTGATAKGRAIASQSLPLCDVFKLSTNCMLRIPYPKPIAVQGYSLVTDGVRTATVEDFVQMSVLASTYDAVEGPISWNKTEVLWELLGDQFGMNRYDVWRNSVYLFQHTEEILWGHPCSAVGEVSNIDAEGFFGDQYCTEAVRKNLSDLVKYVHARRAFTTSVAEAKMAKLRKAKMAELKQRQQQQKQAAKAVAGIKGVPNNATVSMK